MNGSNKSQRSERVVLELISDNKLEDIKKSDDLLFTGKIAVKNEGGFKKLYDLPAPYLIERCTTNYDSMTDVLDARFKHYGWLCNYDSGWNRHLCVLFASAGLLFCYTKPNRGYVIKLSFGIKLEMQSGRKKIVVTDTPPENCLMKIKFGFGALELRLTTDQTKKWRQPLLNAFDGKMPCFELPKTNVGKKSATNMVDVSISACEILSNSNSIESTQILNTIVSANLSTCSEVSLDSLITAKSLSKCDLYEEYRAIQLFLAPMVELNVEITVQDVESETAATQEYDSGIDSSVETVKSIEEFRPIPPVRKSINSSLSSASFSKSMSATNTMTAQLTPADIKPSPRTILDVFNLPVYRLETEREKLSRREPHGRIAEKIRCFEEMSYGNGNKTEAQLISKH